VDAEAYTDGFSSIVVNNRARASSIDHTPHANPLIDHAAHPNVAN
jgi:hypothetical protein